MIESSAHDVERVGDKTAINDAEHRAAQADNAGCLAVAGAVEERPCGGVVKKDQAFRIANQYAVRELGHQRRQPVLLLLELGIGFLYSKLDFGKCALIAIGEPVD